MRAWLVAGYAVALVGVGCASANTGGPGNDGDAAANDAAGDDAGDDGGADAGTDAPADKLTWSYIYATYFGRNTPGHCGTVGCHGTARAGFVCSSQSVCYTSITTNNANVGGQIVSPQTPSKSVLIDPNSSPVFWFNQAGGNMPEGALAPNDTAKAEITAWINAGAPNN
jgi:hypothetical protein